MSLLQRYRSQLDPLRSERYVELLLLVLAVLFLLQLLWGFYRSVFPAIPQPVQPTADALQVVALNDAGAIPAELRSEIVQRPLFWVQRRPTGPAALAAAQAAAEQAAADAELNGAGEIKGLKLAGVFGAGDSAGVIVLSEKQEKKHRLAVGDDINGWALDSVSSTEAVFRNGARRATLELKRGKLLVNEIQANESESAPAASSEPAAAAPAGQPAAEPARKNPRQRKKPGAPENGTLKLGRE